MPMKFPPHPGEVIASELEELGVSVAEAARALGTTRQQLYNVISGKSRVTAEMALRLEQGVGSTADLWLRLQANFDLAHLRNIGEPSGVAAIVPKAAAE